MSPDPILIEIEAFIERTGMAESTFGRLALGDWRLIEELRGRNGKRPRRLWGETQAKLRLFMASYSGRAREREAA